MSGRAIQRWWPEAAVGLLLIAALVWAPLRQHQQRQDALERARALEQRGAELHGAAVAVTADDSARVRELLSFPPMQRQPGRALLDAMELEQALEQRHLAPLVVSWYAGVELSELERDELLLLAAATARLLGSEEGAEHSLLGFASQSAAGLEDIRRALEARCGGCAPEPGVLPATTIPGGLPPSIQGERRALGRAEPPDPVEPLAELVAAVRTGQPVPEQAWSTPGHCGMAALELARAGRTDQLHELLELSVDGPSALDRIVALHAAMQLEAPASWPEGLAKERALAVVQELGSGTR